MFVQLVKELRKRTGAGFLDCKKALEHSDMDMEKAVKWLQAKGVVQAKKNASAIAAEGVVAILTQNNVSIMYEINSQTDFVAQTFEFKTLVNKIGNILINANFTSVEEANAIIINNNKKTIKDLIIEAIAKIGEKIELRKVIKVVKQENQSFGTYVHTNKQVAAIVIIQGGNDQIAKNVSMHVASMNPQFLDESAIDPTTIIDIKKEICKSKTLKGKPKNIKENIIKGMLRKELSKLTLVDQEFVMEKMSVFKYLQNQNAIAKAMFRFEVGEGIKKQEQDFATEVITQITN